MKKNNSLKICLPLWFTQTGQKCQAKNTYQHYKNIVANPTLKHKTNNIVQADIKLNNNQRLRVYNI